MLKTVIFPLFKWVATPAGSAVCTCVLFLTTIFIFSAACHAQPKKSAAKKQLHIRFVNRVDSQLLELGHTYHNPFGEEYEIHNFKYYISSIALQQSNGKVSTFLGSHLVSEADSGSKQIVLQTVDSSFTTISFLLGVDSIYNVSGTQTGDLDPTKGMFWTWNSGYIMAKLEASSPLSGEPNNSVPYHIGGFRTGQNVVRRVTLALAKNARAGTPTSEIVIEANANKWFKGAHDLTIADNPVCTLPGKLAVQFADNYAQMFTIAPPK